MNGAETVLGFLSWSFLFDATELVHWRLDSTLAFSSSCNTLFFLTSHYSWLHDCPWFWSLSIWPGPPWPATLSLDGWFLWGHKQSLFPKDAFFAHFLHSSKHGLEAGTCSWPPNPQALWELQGTLRPTWTPPTRPRELKRPLKLHFHLSIGVGWNFLRWRKSSRSALSNTVATSLWLLSVVSAMRNKFFF